MTRTEKTILKIVIIPLIILLILGVINRLFECSIFLNIFVALIGASATIIAVLISINNEEFLSEKATIEKAKPSLGLISNYMSEGTSVYFSYKDKKDFYDNFFSIRNSDKIEFNIISVEINDKKLTLDGDFFVSKNQVVNIHFPNNIVKQNDTIKLEISTLFNLVKRKYVCIVNKDGEEYHLERITHE